LGVGVFEIVGQTFWVCRMMIPETKTTRSKNENTKYGTVKNRALRLCEIHDCCRANLLGLPNDGFAVDDAKIWHGQNMARSKYGTVKNRALRLCEIHDCCRANLLGLPNDGFIV